MALPGIYWSKISLIFNKTSILSIPKITNKLCNTSCISSCFSTNVLSSRSDLSHGSVVGPLYSPKSSSTNNNLLKICTGLLISQRCKYTKSKEKPVHRKDAASIGEGANMYEPQSPYRERWPRRYGYFSKLHRGGLLPRIDKPFRTMKTYRPKPSWDVKHALFGQNDYIDILGDGNVSPVDLLRGPRWLVGFKGNELQRLIRRMKFQGEKMKVLYPTKHHNMRKRMYYLFKRYNQKRSHFH